MRLLIIHKACMPVYKWSRFFLRTDGRTGGWVFRGSTRGPHGPKNIEKCLYVKLWPISEWSWTYFCIQAKVNAVRTNWQTWFHCSKEWKSSIFHKTFCIIDLEGWFQKSAPSSSDIVGDFIRQKDVQHIHVSPVGNQLHWGIKHLWAGIVIVEIERLTSRNRSGVL